MNAESYIAEQQGLCAEFARMPAECARMIAALLDALHEQDETIKVLVEVNRKLLDR